MQGRRKGHLLYTGQLSSEAYAAFFRFGMPVVHHTILQYARREETSGVCLCAHYLCFFFFPLRKKKVQKTK